MRWVGVVLLLGCPTAPPVCVYEEAGRRYAVPVGDTVQVAVVRHFRDGDLVRADTIWARCTAEGWG